MTAVDSGMRALQFLGLDEEKSTSVGFDVSLISSLSLTVLTKFWKFWIWIWSTYICVCSGIEGGSDYHWLLHAWYDRVRIAQENQGILDF